MCELGIVRARRHKVSDPRQWGTVAGGAGSVLLPTAKALGKYAHCLLGPLEVSTGGNQIHLGGVRARQRAVLAYLLVHSGKAVTVDSVIDALWPAGAPASAKTVVHGHVAQLRRLLEPDRRKGEQAQILVTVPGSALRVADGQVDARRFETLLAGGSQALAGGAAGEAAHLLGEALALWRGQAFGDLAYESWARSEAERLEGLRLVCLEERTEAELQLGRHAELVSDLEALIAAEPLSVRVDS